MIRLYPVDSSMITAVGYKPTEKLLVVQFRGDDFYGYDAVPEYDVTMMLFAESVGKFFTENIRKFPARFPFRKMTAEEVFAP